MFDEDLYLQANPDVEIAVRSGKCPSGELHYQTHGRRERRPLRPGSRPSPPINLDSGGSRRDQILAGLVLDELKGVEIGALTIPLVTRLEGSIVYVDHADTEALKKKYAADPGVNVDDLVEVDGVWGDNSLIECIGSGFDYLVASHVVEHVPDLITWLQEIRAILKPGGTLRLAVPDRRYTFDYYRYETRLHDVLDAFLHRARRPSIRLILEHFSLFKPDEEHHSYTSPAGRDLYFNAAQAQASLALAKTALKTTNYYDVHCWVFTPTSFKALLQQIQSMNLLQFEITYVSENSTGIGEFYAHLTAS